MTCKEVIEFLMAYLDGELESPVRGEFERHLSRCSACVAYLDTYKKSVQLARGACAGGEGLGAVPDELAAAITAAIKKHAPAR